MTDTLVGRLRNAHANSQQRIVGSNIFEEAAAEIERLTREVSICRDIIVNPDPDSEPDAVRLHREKCDALDRALAAESSLSEAVKAAYEDAASWHDSHANLATNRRKAIWHRFSASAIRSRAAVLDSEKM